MRMPPSNTYQMDYRCTNCGRRETKSIPRGDKASTSKCNNCGCKTSEPTHQWSGRY